MIRTSKTQPLYALAVMYSAVAFCQQPASPEPSEAGLRQQFLQAYQSAKTPEEKITKITLLKGAKEKESLRLLAGMLGDTSEGVRRSACGVMAATTDADGYLIKPLVGALNDSSQSVRIAAVDALSNATLKADACKALTFALLVATGQQPPTPQRADELLILIKALDSGLEKLTGQKSIERDVPALGKFWKKYWGEHEDELRSADEKKLEQAPAQRAGDLPRDSFDSKSTD